jgi:hypothetical protein
MTNTCATCDHLGYLNFQGKTPWCTCPWSKVGETKLDATCECWEAREE